MRFLRRHEVIDDKNLTTWSEADDEALAADAARTFGPETLERVDENAGKIFIDSFASVSRRAARVLAEAYRRRLDFEARERLLAEHGRPAPVIGLFERLPYYGQVMPELTVEAEHFAPLSRTAPEERDFGRAPNPDLHIVLNRLRKVINAIIDMMGGILPTTCTVEIAREALSEEEAAKRRKQNLEREKLRDSIIERIKSDGKPLPVGPGLDALVDRWLAAIRQGWRDYDGNPIAPSQLRDGSIYQLDHVAPAAFGEFRNGNMFVSRFNQQKGKRLPWEAFPEFRPALLAFAIFGKERQIEGLEKASKRLKGKELAKVKGRLARAEEALERLKASGEHRVDLLARLKKTTHDQIDTLLDPKGEARQEKDTRRRVKNVFRPSEQSALFAKLGPDAAIPEGGPAARDVANIGWSTKLARDYVTHLGARPMVVKPWAVHLMRMMFDINKERTDLRNHAVDAFFIAHFDEKVMSPAFQRFHGGHYEDLYDRKQLEDALAKNKGAFAALENNIESLAEVLPTIATAHRAENKWNPGDAEGGSFGKLGGENLYAFHPGRVQFERIAEAIGKLDAHLGLGPLLKEWKAREKAKTLGPAFFALVADMKGKIVDLMNADAEGINDKDKRRLVETL
ncbi:MAG: hypothetical protein FJX47_20050, partial [Alphaproteobacteria bacterium]|nr:hypothetical protein [Alphaproteobacteria bacterium]